MRPEAAPKHIHFLHAPKVCDQTRFGPKHKTCLRAGPTCSSPLTSYEAASFESRLSCLPYMAAASRSEILLGG